MATINDKFNKASNNTSPNLSTTVSQQRLPGGDVLMCDSLSFAPSDTAIHFQTYRRDLATGEIIKSSQVNYKGIASPDTNRINNVTVADGVVDPGNQSGDTVEILPTAGWVNDLVDGISRVHEQDGSLKARSVPLEAINAPKSKGALMTDSNGAVSSGKLPVSSIDWLSASAVEVVDFAFGFGLSCHAIKVGRIVFASVDGIATMQSTVSKLSEIVPAGFKPGTKTVFQMLATNSGRPSGHAAYIIRTDGTIAVNSTGGHNEWRGSCMWVVGGET